MYRTIKSIIGIALIFTLVPANGCTSASRYASSVKEFSCINQMQKIKIPGTPGMTMSTTRCEDYVFKEAKISRAITLFVEEYSSQFDLKEINVWELLRGLHIEVSAIPRSVSSAYDIKGKLVTNIPVSGLALSTKHIWVEITTTQIWSTSLTHELVHIIVWMQNSGIHGDPDHEGDQFSGWSKNHTLFIKHFNRILLDNDI